MGLPVPPYSTGVIERFSKLPTSLAEQSRSVRLADVPTLLIHPDWLTPAPAVLWMHGRTAYKELDSGRYLRWMKAGIATIAIDLPSHGERPDHRTGNAEYTLEILAELLGEIDRVIDALSDPVWQNVFDLDRLGIGGMSMGGMAALRRLCDPHEFLAAAVESSCGDLLGLYDPERGSKPWGLSYPREHVMALDPMPQLVGNRFRPIPLLALHSEADRIVPWQVQKGFLDALRDQYQRLNADPVMVRAHTWPTTGAPEEHSGFGQVSNEAKTIQTDFFVRNLRVVNPK